MERVVFWLQIKYEYNTSYLYDSWFKLYFGYKLNMNTIKPHEEINKQLLYFGYKLNMNTIRPFENSGLKLLYFGYKLNMNTML